MSKKLAGIAALLLLTTGSAFAAQLEPPCAGNSRVVEPCFSAAGRLVVSNGTPSVRIVVTDTTRVLAVFDILKSSGESLPADVESLFAGAPFETVVSGDFEVCPLTPFHDGEMQLVCVEHAANLSARRLNRTPTK